MSKYSDKLEEMPLSEVLEAAELYQDAAEQRSAWMNRCQKAEKKVKELTTALEVKDKADANEITIRLTVEDGQQIEQMHTKRFCGNFHPKTQDEKDLCWLLNTFEPRVRYAREEKFGLEELL